MFSRYGCWARSHGRLFTAATEFFIRLGISGSGQEFLPAVLAAEVEHFSIALGVDRSRFINGHATDGVFGFGFRIVHGQVRLLIVIVTIKDRATDALAQLQTPHKRRQGLLLIVVQFQLQHQVVELHRVLQGE